MGEPIKDDYFNTIKEEVRGKLPEYLEMHGRTVSRNGTLRCLFPENHRDGDKTPSANIYGDRKRYKCFGCDVDGDIFAIASLLEGYEIEGPGFILTVKDLADRLGVPVDPALMPHVGESARIKASTREIYSEIAEYLIQNGKGMKALMGSEYGRNYDEDTARAVVNKVAMGVVDPRELTEHLKSKFGEEHVKSIPLYNSERECIDPSVFGPERLTIAVNSRRGNPESFFCRCSEDLIKKNVERGLGKMKYKFASGFKASEHLFMVDRAMQAIRREKVIYLVEGPTDAIAMHLAGFENTVALFGKNLSEAAVRLLEQFDVLECVIALDGDHAGIQGAKKALLALKGHDMTVNAACMPEGEDPDSMMQKGKLAGFMDAAAEDAVSFILKNDSFMNDASKALDSRYREMIQFVSTITPLRAKLRKYAKIISDVSSYHIEDIFNDLINYSEKHILTSMRENKIWEKVQDLRDGTLMDKLEGLEKAVDDVRLLVAKSGRDVTTHTWNQFLELKSGERKLPKILQTGMERLDESLSIECGSLTFMSGWPSNGKSSVVRALIPLMIEKNPDLFVLYVCCDDTADVAHVSQIALAVKMPKKQVRETLDDGTFINQHEVANSGFDKIRDLFNNRLAIFGSDSCRSVPDIKQLVEQFRDKHKEGDFLLIVDALQDLTDVHQDDQRAGIEWAVSEIKAVSAMHNIATVVISHLVKSKKEGRRPTSRDLKGSSFLEYAAKGVVLLHMDAHYDEHTQLVWDNSRWGTRLKHPVIEFMVAKDKDKKANETVFLKFDPIIGTIEEAEDRQHDTYKNYIREKEAGGGDGTGGFDSMQM